MIEILLDRGAEGLQPVIAQREPELQRAKATGKLHRLFKKRESCSHLAENKARDLSTGFVCKKRLWVCAGTGSDWLGPALPVTSLNGNHGPHPWVNAALDPGLSDGQN
jgi:hypothetical protein